MGAGGWTAGVGCGGVKRETDAAGVYFLAGVGVIEKIACCGEAVLVVWSAGISTGDVIFVENGVDRGDGFSSIEVLNDAVDVDIRVTSSVEKEPC